MEMIKEIEQNYNVEDCIIPEYSNETLKYIKIPEKQKLEELKKEIFKNKITNKEIYPPNEPIDYLKIRNTGINQIDEQLKQKNLSIEKRNEYLKQAILREINDLRKYLAGRNCNNCDFRKNKNISNQKNLQNDIKYFQQLIKKGYPINFKREKSLDTIAQKHANYLINTNFKYGHIQIINGKNIYPREREQKIINKLDKNYYPTLENIIYSQQYELNISISDMLINFINHYPFHFMPLILYKNEITDANGNKHYQYYLPHLIGLGIGRHNNSKIKVIVIDTIGIKI